MTTTKQQQDSSLEADGRTHPVATTGASGDVADSPGVLRRSVLRGSALALGGLAMSTPALAGFTDSDGSEHADPADSAGTGHADPGAGPLDAPSGFGVEVLSGHATFPDEVAATFRMQYEDGDGAIVSNLPRDASTVVVAKVTWQPEGTSGWHTHPGPVLVSVADGAVEVTNARDCIPRTYVAGQAFVDPGQGSVHVAKNPSTTDIATAYATFLGVPNGGAPTIWTPVVEC